MSLLVFLCLPIHPVSIALPLTLSRSGPIWLDNVKCRGDEERLIDCRARPFGVHNCNQFDDAGVKCRELCTSGTVRLRGESIGEGILEVCYQNVWGTVCGDGWTGSNTVVACRHLGFSTRGTSNSLCCLHVSLVPRPSSTFTFGGPAYAKSNV